VPFDSPLLLWGRGDDSYGPQRKRDILVFTGVGAAKKGLNSGLNFETDFENSSRQAQLSSEPYWLFLGRES